MSASFFAYNYHNGAYMTTINHNALPEFQRHTGTIEKVFQRRALKRGRTATLQQLKVTSLSGRIYDADDTSQQCMARAILVMDDSETITWTLADNTRAAVTRAELLEALKLAVQQQTAMWALD